MPKHLAFRLLSVAMLAGMVAACSKDKGASAPLLDCGGKVCASPEVCAPDKTCRAPCAEAACPTGATCLAGFCVGDKEPVADAYRSCDTGAIRCAGRATIEICNVVSAGWGATQTCERPEDCHAAAAAKSTTCNVLCTAGQVRCVGSTIEVCDTASQFKASQTCGHT